MKSIFIYGTGGHSTVVADIAKLLGYTNIIFLDDKKCEYDSLDDVKDQTEIPMIIAIGSNKIRKRIFRIAKEYNFKVVSLIHPSATISESSSIGEGTVVMSNVVVNPFSKVGFGSILNTSSIIEHENVIEDFVHISPGVSLAGNVKVNELTHIGIGSSVIQGIKIGRNSIIGAGSVVIKDISSNKLCYGIPCKEIKDLNE